MTHYLLSVIEPDGPMPDPEFLEPIIKAVGVVDDAMRDAGVWVFAGGLHQPEHRDRAARQGRQVLTTDGPYVEAKEHLGGFTIIDVADLDEALTWGGQLARGHHAARSRSGRSGSDGSSGDRSPDEIAAVFRTEHGRAVAVLARSFGRSTSPRRPCRTRSSRPCSTGRPTGCRRARPAGSSRPPSARPSTGCGARRRATTGTPQAALLYAQEHVEVGPVRDDQLRLVFTCCHPALSPEAQVALTLRMVGGLTTEEIAHAFLVPGPDDAAAAGAGQGQDPRRAHPVPGAVGRGPARPAAHRAGRGLPGVHRGPPASSDRRCARTCAPRRSGWAGCWSSSCPTSPRRPACWR